jgi:hypothetical protein|tara:strand:+ start:814 stop:1068 length:255 start_codon:yes stop_codon:yes gene_type:complete
MSGIVKKLKPKARPIDPSVNQRISENEAAAKAEADKRNQGLQSAISRRSKGGRKLLMDSKVTDPFGEGRLTLTRQLGAGRNPRG